MLKPMPVHQPEPQLRASNRTFVSRNNGQNNDCENSNPRQNASRRPIVIEQPAHDLGNKAATRRPLSYLSAWKIWWAHKDSNLGPAD